MGKTKKMQEIDASTSDMVTTSEKKSRILYRIAATIFFALSVGGLFLGAIGMRVQALSHGIVSDAIKPKGSLFSWMYGAFRSMKGDLSAAFAVSKRLGVFTFMGDFALILVALSVLVSLACAVASYISKRRVRALAVTGGTFVTVAYAWLFLHEFFLTSALNGVGLLDSIDIPLLIVSGICFFLLVADAIARAKGMGFLNALLALLFLAGILGTVLPLTVFSQIFSAVLVAQMRFYDVAAVLLIITLGCNFMISVLRLSARRGAGFDVFRTVLQLLFLILFIIGCVAQNPFGLGRAAIFSSSLNQTVAIAIAAGSTVAALLLSVVIAILASRRKRRRAAEEEAAAYGIPEERTEAAAPAPQPVQPQPAPVVFYPMPVYSSQPAPQPAPAPAPAPQPAPKPQPAPIEETPMSEFERRMAALAKGEAPEPQPVPQPQPARPAPKAAAGLQQTSLYDSQYTYDPFMNSLTPQEKNEFGDLFIGMKHGNFGLPPYVIGGDNTEFFQKVFIYLGRFRSHISSELLSRIYDYLNA